MFGKATRGETDRSAASSGLILHEHCPESPHVVGVAEACIDEQVEPAVRAGGCHDWAL